MTIFSLSVHQPVYLTSDLITRTATVEVFISLANRSLINVSLHSLPEYVSSAKDDIYACYILEFDPTGHRMICFVTHWN